VLGSLPEVPGLARFGVYSLSNVFDWSDDATVARWAEALAAAARAGSAVLIRKLNNDRDVRRFFAPAFRFDDALGADLLAEDRSLFYDRIEVAFRT
jgi:S-adenosylmethionine-diacylglycerol 3-amino-3-carboxypropyl transferase